MKKRDGLFWESALLNNATYIDYYNRLMEIGIGRFQWRNLPDTVDERFLELTLFAEGKAIFFKDEELGYLTLQCALNGPMDVYRNPINRRAFASNGYNIELDSSNSVIIYNNLLRKPCMRDVEMFAKRLYNIDRAIDVNANAQKTPILIKCNDSQRLTMLNTYKNYDGNEPVIFGTDDFNDKNFGVLQTGAPYVCDKLYNLKTQYWNEALTYLGITNTNTMKRERLLSEEITRNMGGIIASRNAPLEARQKAADAINKMFGLNIEVDFNPDYRDIDSVLNADEVDEKTLIDEEKK